MNTKIACLIALTAGSLALLLNFDLTRKFGVVAMAALTLLYGFTSAPIRLPAWMRCRELRGVALVYMGVFATFTPPEFVISAILIVIGTREVLTSRPVVVVTNRGLRESKGDIVLKSPGNLATRD